MSVVAASCMRRPPAPPEPRERSRSPLSRRLQGVLEAHLRNRRTHRGGIQAKKRTRAIHRHLLEILLEYIVRLLTLLDPGAAGRRQFVQREHQVRERLQFLEWGWPDSKQIVLPRLEEYLRENQEEEVSIDSVSEVETIVFSEPPSEGEPQEDTENPFGDPFLRQVFERARDQGGFVIPSQLPVDPGSFLGQRLGRDSRFRREGDPIPSSVAVPKEPEHPPSASVPKEPVHPSSASVPKEPAYPPPEVRPSVPSSAPKEPVYPPPKPRPRGPSPVELQTAKASASSSSSSSRPAIAKGVVIRPAVVKAAAVRPAVAKAAAIRPAVAKPKPKAKAIAIPGVGEEDERWDPEILRIGAEIYDRQGQLMRSLQPRIDQVPLHLNRLSSGA